MNKKRVRISGPFVLRYRDNMGYALKDDRGIVWKH